MKNLPIIGKFLTIMALFGVFALGVAGYAGTRIMDIDTSYSDLISQDTAAATAISRANRALQGARSAIAELTIARSDKESRFSTGPSILTGCFRKIHGHCHCRGSPAP